MKIWHLSDTHTFHNLLNIPEGIDLVIFSGDCSNPRDPYNNEPENYTRCYPSVIFLERRQINLIKLK